MVVVVQEHKPTVIFFTMSSELKEKTAKGLLWGGLNNGIMQLLNLLFGIVLARLLTPADYGMVGMLAIFSQIAATLQESGFTAALANRKEVKHADYNAVFWFNVMVSAGVYLILFFSAPLIADFYHNPELVSLARYVFIGFFITSLGIAQSAYLFRNLMVKQRSLIGVIALTISGIVGIVLAYNGFAYWGIATQTLVYVSVYTLMLWYFSSWRPTLAFDFTPIKEMVGFSSKMLLTAIFNVFNNNMFSVILGRYYSEKEVGQYNQANKWNYMGFSLIGGMINGIAQPTFNQVGDDQERQRRVFRKMLRFTAFVSFPAMFGLAFIAPELITITITDKWIASAHLLQIIAIWGAFNPLSVLYSNFIVSKGKSNIILYNSLVLGTLQIGLIFALKGYGIQTMVAVNTAVNIMWLFVWHHFLFKEIRLSLWLALKDTIPYAVIAVSSLVIVHFITLSIANIVALFFAKIILTAVLYTLTLWLCGSKTLKESINYLLKRK